MNECNINHIYKRIQHRAIDIDPAINESHRISSSLQPSRISVLKSDTIESSIRAK